MKIFALLQLDKPIASIQPIPIKAIAATHAQSFSVYGFPSINGLSTQGLFGAKLANDWFQLQVTQAWPEVVGGFSGAPLWHDENGMIMGMMVASNYEHQAYAIAASSLYNVWHKQGQLLELLTGLDGSLLESAYRYCRQQQPNWTTELPQDLSDAIADLYKMDEGQDSPAQLVNFVVYLLVDETVLETQKNHLRQWARDVAGVTDEETAKRCDRLRSNRASADIIGRAETHIREPQAMLGMPEPIVVESDKGLSDRNSERLSPLQPDLELPGGTIPLESPFYMGRPPIEELCYREIQKPGSLLRIKAPQQMGKTSLLQRILSRARQLKSNIVLVDFQIADPNIFEDIHKFLFWLCAYVYRQLDFPEASLKEYWDEEIGAKVSCIFFFENYILKNIPGRLVLSFDEVDVVLSHPEIAQEFFPLLRFWYEQAKLREQFRKLSIVIIQSAELFVPRNPEYSPFNVGLSVELSYFSLGQVIELAQRHGLNWGEQEAAVLNDMVGGHPYLIHSALYHIASGEMTLEKILANAPTEFGIYRYHLQQLFFDLNQFPELAQAALSVMESSEPVSLKPSIAYKLKAMGIIAIKGSIAVPKNKLYREYLCNHLMRP
ncbi:MAG: AAA-like domain-containing protein [Cyanobacteria bacterium P01_G01_bin.54]